MAGESVTTSAFSRLFLIDGRAGPANVPTYEGLIKAGTPVFPQGSITTIRIPDPDQYGAFKRVGRVRGAPDDPQLPLTGRYGTEVSKLLRLVRQGCEIDAQVHLGTCQDPRDFNRGWDKIVVLEGGTGDQWTTDNDLGALGPDEQNVINEQTTLFGLDLYEITKLRLASLAGSTLVSPVIDIIVCDRASCGSCGIPSDGCDKIFAVQTNGSGSIGGAPSLVYSGDGGGSWQELAIDTIGDGNDAVAVGCVGSNIVVLSVDTCSIHIASIVDLLAGNGTWTEITTGFVGCPEAITSQGPANVWIVGDTGYIYFTSNIEDGVEVQDAGSATTEDLVAIHSFDTLNVVAVGTNNAVVRTSDGQTWSAIVGPNPGVDLTCVAMHGVDEWFVGDASGSLWYTRDGGANWVTRGFFGSGSGSVNAIKFASPTVGYMVVTNGAGAGRLLRTISGGNSWYIAPESNALTPTNSGLNAVAVCTNVNVVFAAGTDTADGIILKGS